MFTGIVEEIGVVRKINRGNKSAQLTIEAQQIFDDLKLGDSVATNGVCLTVASHTDATFTADVMNQSLENTSLGLLKSGARVNLERALRLSDRLGGHIVSGHVDCVGKIEKVYTEDTAKWFTLSLPQEHIRYLVYKGSVTLDGISLTVARLGTDSFSVSTIPVTQKDTTLGEKQQGDLINIELDVVAKYIERLTCFQGKKEVPKSAISWEFLKKNGFA